MNSSKSPPIRVAIMQPYFFPYLGYFQLISSVDQFVLFDNVQFTRGWINRNRYLIHGRDAYFTLPLTSAPQLSNINQRTLSKDFDPIKILNKLSAAYHKAPYFEQTFELVQRILSFKEINLAHYLSNSIFQILNYFKMTTKLLTSSDLTINHRLKSEERIIGICKALGASSYVNAINGVSLYSKQKFDQHEIELLFIKSSPFEYKQFNNPFTPMLSIIDVMMFNSLHTIKHQLKNGYTLV